MAENGFSVMKRSLGRKLQRLLRSFLESDFDDSPPDRSTAKEFVMVLDAEIAEKLSERAHEEDMDTGPFVLELLNKSLHGQDTLSMIELWKQLTRREQEVTALACQGLTNHQIAETLYITEETVKKHISSALKKFNIRGRGVLKWMLEGWNFDNSYSPWEK
jgi:DNA-binding NarL/FixJ family response regulator